MLSRTVILSLPGVIAAVFLLATGIARGSEYCSVFKSPFTAVFYGSYKGWRVDATQQLSAQGKEGWQFTQRAENPIGNITQQSVFSRNADQLIISDHYRHGRKILFKNELLETVFDWKEKQAVSTRGSDSVRKVSLKGGELDDLNYQLALRCDLQEGKTEFHYNVVDWNEVDDLEFRVIGEEKLPTELGMLDTVIVKRIRNNNNRITTLWFAKELDYQMVKLLQEERKDTEAYLLYIKSVSKP